MATEQTPLTLTCPNLNFSFAEFEVPETLKSLGGTQQHSRQRFPGGRQVIQTLGAFPHDSIKWSGIINGPNAFPRAILLDSIRQGGAPCTLSFGLWKYVGILSELELDVRSQGWIPYTAEFTPAEDQSQTGATVATPSPQASYNAIAGALAQQVAIYSGSNPTILSSLSQISGVLSTVTGAIAAAGGQLAAVSSSVLAAQGATLTSLSLALAPSGPVPDVTNQVNLVAGLTATEAAMSDLLWQALTVALIQQLGFLLALPPVNVRVITVANPCLLILASQFYGDAGQWATIAAANNNFPIFATGVFNILIPGAT